MQGGGEGLRKEGNQCGQDWVCFKCFLDSSHLFLRQLFMEHIVPGRACPEWHRPGLRLQGVYDPGKGLTNLRSYDWVFRRDLRGTGRGCHQARGSGIHWLLPLTSSYRFRLHGSNCSLLMPHAAAQFCSHRLSHDMVMTFFYKVALLSLSSQFPSILLENDL